MPKNEITGWANINSKKITGWANIHPKTKLQGEQTLIQKRNYRVSKNSFKNEITVWANINSNNSKTKLQSFY